MNTPMPETIRQLDEARAQSLRAAHYNATVTRIRRVHEDLLILDVEPDKRPLAYVPGQYTVLGLGGWEPCIEGTQEEAVTAKQWQMLVKRAYSMSCRLLDHLGRLVRPGDERDLEFYVSLVRRGAHLPALTPRLFLLQESDRLFLGTRAHGHYTLAAVQDDDHVLFAATGTGEAPHNSMIAELLTRGHRGNIANIVCVRFRRDLAYLAEHQELERRFVNYRYIPLTTREAENLDPAAENYAGKLYIQDFIESADFEDRTRVALSPERTHVFLCGNPDMIGAPPARHSRTIFGLLSPEAADTRPPVSPGAGPPLRKASRLPRQRGMVELLERLGFVIDMPHKPGNIHFEQYW